MITTDVNKCNLSLNFYPQRAWPKALPPICWNNYLLCGFKHSLSTAIELGCQPFEELFTSIYPSLSFSELSGIYQKVNNQLNINWNIFFAFYNFKFSENLHLNLNSIAQTPLEFQIWCANKQMNPNDLSILKSTFNSLVSIENVNLFLENLAANKPSKSTGTNVLTMGLELLMMREPVKNILPRKVEDWELQLKKLRYPNTYKTDQNKFQQINKLPKLNGLTTQWKRQGDKSGVEIKFIAQNKNELETKINSLIKWKDNNSESIWP